MTLVILIAVYLICSTSGLMLLKNSVTGLEFSNAAVYFKLLLNYKFITGFLLYAASFMVWIIMLSKRDLIYIYPIVIGLSYLFIMLTAAIFLKEHLTAGKIFGASLIICGIFIIFF